MLHDGGRVVLERVGAAFALCDEEVGGLVYPLGLPTCTLLLLIKNGGEIKRGVGTYDRYEFLVAGDTSFVAALSH